MEPTLTLPGTAVVGTGFLGSRLVAALRAQGRDVVGIDPAAPADLPCAVADLPPDCSGEAFRLIFCCMATHGGDAAAYRTCYPDSARVLVRRFPMARLVFCSSLSVYGVTDGRVADEQAPTRSDSPRAALLLQAESTVLEAGGIVARLAPLYGEGRCELLRRHLAGGKRLPGPGNRILNYLHRDDAVAALLCLAERGRGGCLYNVCGESLPHAEAYRLLETCTGVPAATGCAPPSSRGSGNLRPDCGRLCGLGWVPRHRLQDFFRSSAA